MTDNEKRYKTNAEKCLAVGHFLEVMRESEKEYKKYDRLKAAGVKVVIKTVQEELNDLYDEQIELFETIRQEKIAAEKAAIVHQDLENYWKIKNEALIKLKNK